MDIVRVGKPLVDFIALCYHADRPFLLSGPHGVGKSEILEHTANQLGLEFISRDLSIMEPPDLVGIPKTKAQTTIYHPPDFLPRRGKGLLVFEELNRCEKYMQAPCLQLLTARKLNDYHLPEGWLPVAAINPDGLGYMVHSLDGALLSRFVQVQVVPDQGEWLRWAKQNEVHSSVVRYVEGDESIFDHVESNPRAWAYVSRLMYAAEQTKSSAASLRAAIMGLVGEIRGSAFLRSLKQIQRPLTANEILHSMQDHRNTFSEWLKGGRTDLVEASLRSLLIFLQPESEYTAARNDPLQWRNLSAFLHALPGDLTEQAQGFFTDRGYDFPSTPQPRKKRRVKK